MRARRFAWAALALVAASGCGALYPLLPERERLRASGAGWSLEVQTEAPPGVPQKAVCAMQLLEQVRQQPAFVQALRARRYSFDQDAASADTSVEGVVRCALREIHTPWRLRHSHWPEFFNRELGANCVKGPRYVRTYDVYASRWTVGQLASHLLHEHMHTCGYRDEGGDNGRGLATYAASDVVTALVGEVDRCQLQSSGAPAAMTR